MKVIDFRFRPHTESIIKSLVESPLFRDALIASGLDLDAFMATAKPLADIVTELHEVGISQAVLVGRDAETTYGYASNNEELKGFVQADPKLFKAFAGLDPHKGMAAIKELATRIEEDGFAGAAIDPIYNKLPIDAAEFYPIYAKCCELDVPIIITTGRHVLPKALAAALPIPIKLTALPHFSQSSKSSSATVHGHTLMK